MIIGITGKIGTGKSTVGEYLRQKGLTVIDCDQIVHELYEPGGAGTEKIRSFFAETYLDKRGGVNRKKLFRMLLKSPKKWEVMNRMIHPLVAEELRRRLAPPRRWLRKINTKNDKRRILVALEIQIYTPKLFNEFVDELWVLESPKEAQYKRLIPRNLEAKIIDQLNRLQRSDIHEKTIRIPNNGTLAELFDAIEKQLKRLTQFPIME